MTCYHCGDDCENSNISLDNHQFCCLGCKTVYEILNQNDLNNYYDLEEGAGIKIDTFKSKEKYAFLDIEDIQQQYVLFKDEKITKISFYIPQIHCSSCIWLLENLNRLKEGIVYTTVNFTKRQADITFKNDKLSLRQVVELLASIGYEPDLKKRDVSDKTSDKTIIYKIGIAGFCFGNIMLLAFPEYLGIDDSFDEFRSFFGYISLFLSLPVFFYAGFGYFTSALKGIQQRYINIDIPIALGMLTLFGRSTYEILSETGAGYLDSLAGLVFFLLLGKWFQQKTYDSLSFNRDYKSYFPIAVNKVTRDNITPVKLDDLLIGDKIELRNNELIPADGVLLEGNAYIDYSFVTGESEPVRKKTGDFLFAGGKQVGTKIQLELTKGVNNSYLTQLWNQDAFKKPEDDKSLNSISNTVSKYFTLIILLITVATTVYWALTDTAIMWNAITAVLIVACPCALALSVPFTLGNTTRIMGNKGLYLKDASVIEKMAAITTIVFDKTGTITHSGSKSITYKGEQLTEEEEIAVKSIVSNSVHPLSLGIRDAISSTTTINPTEFKEVTGKGIQGIVNGKNIRLGSADFIDHQTDSQNTVVYVEINGEIKGEYIFTQNFRKGLKNLLYILKKNYTLHLLTGDNNHQKYLLVKEFQFENLHFSQSPMEKLKFIEENQSKGNSTLMLGDGLNDAGALKQSDVGIAIADNIHQFSPACDAILNANQFNQLDYFLALSNKSITIIKLSFTISFLYNIVGLSFAVTGSLSPIVAAILMPLSSITVVVFSTFATDFVSKRI